VKPRNLICFQKFLYLWPILMIGTKLHVDHGSPYQFQWGGWQGGGQRQKGFCPKATGTDQVKDDDINKGCNYI
jgi:hypothetical protein